MAKRIVRDSGRWPTIASPTGYRTRDGGEWIALRWEDDHYEVWLVKA